MHRSRTDVRIPTGLAIGQVIGKQGSNLKYLQTSSPAGGQLYSKCASSERACRFQSQAQDQELATSAYPHPKQFKYIVSQVDNPSDPLLFAPVDSDVVTQATNRKETLYKVQREPALSELGSSLTEDRSHSGRSHGLLDALASLSVQKEPQFFTTNRTAVVLDSMVAAAKKAAQATPRLTELKVAFNLGSQFFYAGRGMQGPSPHPTMSINSMNAMELGGHEASMKSVYSNAANTAQSKLARRHLVSKLNFNKVGAKTTASVYIKNKELNTSLVVAFVCSRDKLSLRKVKSGTVKPFYLTFMTEPPSQDVRLKLIGQNQFAKGSSEIKSLDGIIAGSAMRSGQLYIPCSSSHEVDKACIKTKEIYEGTYKGRVVRIAFNTVSGECSGQEHHELTGRMPALNNNIQAALSDSADTSQLIIKAGADLQILSDFCKELAAAC